MSTWLIALVTGIYIGIAVLNASEGHWSMATVYAGYALANTGLMFA